MTTMQAAGKSWLRFVPLSLIVLRTILGPALLLASKNSPSYIVVAIMLAAMLSDIFDGVIARKFKIVTERLRVADSRTDAWFFMWVGVSCVVVAPDILRAYVVPIAIEVGLQISSYAYDLLRYKRISSLHAVSAKIWAFTLYLATIGILAYHTGVLIWVAFGFGIISAIDALAIKLLIPEWQHDVLSTFHALALTRKLPAERP